MINRVCEYIRCVKYFAGTSTELTVELEKITGEKIHPPTLSKRLLQNADYLQSVGVVYKTKRTGHTAGDFPLF